jgi:aminopeptidase N
MSKRVRRLFLGFKPDNYKLKLSIDHEHLTFSGMVTIEGKKVGRPSKRLTFHQKGLKFKSASVTHHDKKGDSTPDIVRINTHDSYNEVRLHTNQELYSGKYTVTIEFEGKITDSMQGIYPCYFESEGAKQHLVATQFESHHAREAFPCIDEPEAKATFDLELMTLNGLTALSNMPLKQQTINQHTSTVFETTPIMSTYLLAFVVGNIHCVQAETKRGVVVSTWGSAAQPSNSLKFANAEAVKVLDYFETYFDTPFPLPKCDQIALPDFESGAMENWGLITYREIALLTDPDNRSLSSEQYVAMVIAHELSHQWFGNLVTMKWWDDLWLNESFASIMEHVALADLHPDWEQWEQYVSSDVIACSNRDIYPDVQPIRADVRHPDEIGTLFDPAIVYAKGGRLIKMLIDYIGVDDFRLGLKRYFDKHAYQNTTRDDLWAVLSEATGKDIAGFMNPWIEQSGMPLLQVDRPSATTLSLSQSRFMITDETEDNKQSNAKWPIPLLTSKPVSIEIFSDNNITLDYAAETPLFNSHGSGHYLINYLDKTDKERIAGALVNASIPSESRINTLNDMLLLSRRGDVSLVDILNIVKDCAQEPRDAVWALICQSVGLANMLTEGDDKSEKFLNMLRVDLARETYARLEWEDMPSDDPNTNHLRQTMISLMIGGEDPETIDRCINTFNLAPNIQSLPAEQRGMIIGAVVRHDPNVNIDKLLDTYQQTNDPDIQLSISAAVCRTKNPDTIDMIIVKALGKNGLARPQDVFRWYAYLMRNRYSREAAWNWLTTEWSRLIEMFGNSKNLDYFVNYSAGPMSTDSWHQKFSEFFDPQLDNISLERNIRIAHTEIQGRIAWRARDEDNITKWLASEYAK